MTRVAIDQVLDGYRFSLRYYPNDRATETREMIVLVIAGSEDEAVRLARIESPKACDVERLGCGPQVLREARARGATRYKAFVLQASGP